MSLRLLMVAASGAAVNGGAARAPEAEVQASLQRTLAAQARPPYVTADAEGKKLWKLTQAILRTARARAGVDRGNEAAAADGRADRRAADSATHEGLDPQLYNVALLEQRRQEARKGFLTKKGFEPKEAGALDVWLTYLYMKYASDLADGLSDLAHADPRVADQAGEVRSRRACSRRRSQNNAVESVARAN